MFLGLGFYSLSSDSWFWEGQGREAGVGGSSMRSVLIYAPVLDKLSLLGIKRNQSSAVRR